LCLLSGNNRSDALFTVRLRSDPVAHPGTDAFALNSRVHRIQNPVTLFPLKLSFFDKQANAGEL
jgi:hypothetical protein